LRKQNAVTELKRTLSQSVAIREEKFTKLCHQMWETLSISTPFPDWRYLVPFWRHLRSKLKPGKLEV